MYLLLLCRVRSVYAVSMGRARLTCACAAAF